MELIFLMAQENVTKTQLHSAHADSLENPHIDPWIASTVNFLLSGSIRQEPIPFILDILATKSTM